MKTYLAKKEDVQKKWVLIDAEGKPLGRVAAKAASILRGKNKPTFTPHVDTGDNVIIINAGKVKLTGNKTADKTYYRHSGFPGGIKSVTASQLLESKPGDLLKIAVKGMLPKTRLGRTLFKNVRVYSEAAHPHTSQSPETVTV